MTLAVVLLLHVLVLSCGMYVSDSYPSLGTQPISWQCPTPSPIPTVLLRNDSNNEPPPTPTTTHPVYSTPVPTVTPYIKTGSTYYAGERIQVPTTPLTLSATRAGDQAVSVTYARSTTNQAGLALVAWSEIDQAAGDMQIMIGWSNPSALVTQNQQP